MKQNEDTVFKLLMAQILLVSMHKSLQMYKGKKKIEINEYVDVISNATIQFYSSKMEAD